MHAAKVGALADHQRFVFVVILGLARNIDVLFFRSLYATVEGQADARYAFGVVTPVLRVAATRLNDVTTTGNCVFVITVGHSELVFDLDDVSFVDHVVHLVYEAALVGRGQGDASKVLRGFCRHFV